MVSKMSQLISFEFEKLLHRRVALYIIAALLAANCFILRYQINHPNEQAFSIKDISLVYDEIINLSPTQQIAQLNADIEQNWQFALEQSDSFQFGYTDVRWLVIEQIETALTYDDYLQAVADQAESMLSASFFVQPGTFNYRNIELTAKTYSKLEGLQISADISEGILLITDNHVPDVFLGLSLVVISMYLLISEREEGVLAFVKPTKYGYSHTILAKAAVIIVVSTALVVLFYVASLLAVATDISLGNLSRPIQSLTGYMTSPLRMTVSCYLCLFIMMKALAMASLMSIFYLICIVFKNISYSSLVAILLFGIQTAMLFTVDKNSILSPFAFFNLAALLDTSSYFSNYVNVNLFGVPVNAIASGVLTSVLAIIGGVGFGAYAYINEATTTARRNRLAGLLKTERSSKGEHVVLLFHETHKLMLINKGLVILLVFLSIQYLYFGGLRYRTDIFENYYLRYATRLDGELSDEKLAFLESEQERFDSISEDIQSVFERLDNGEIDDRYASYLLSRLSADDNERVAFERAYTQYLELEKLSAEGLSVSFIYQSPWDKLLGSESQSADLQAFAKLFVVLILSLSAFGAIEKTSNMESIVSISVRGSKAVTRAKMILCGAFTLIATIAAFLPRLIVVFRVYGLNHDHFNVAARNLTEVEYKIGGFSILGCLIFKYLACLAIAFTVAVAILALSKKLGNTITTMLVSATVFLLPVVVMLLV
jgi:hypothetical protein